MGKQLSAETSEPLSRCIDEVSDFSAEQYETARRVTHPISRICIPAWFFVGADERQAVARACDEIDLDLDSERIERALAGPADPEPCARRVGMALRSIEGDPYLVIESRDQAGMRGARRRLCDRRVPYRGLCWEAGGQRHVVAIAGEELEAQALDDGTYQTSVRVIDGEPTVDEYKMRVVRRIEQMKRAIAGQFRASAMGD